MTISAIYSDFQHRAIYLAIYLEEHMIDSSVGV